MVEALSPSEVRKIRKALSEQRKLTEAASEITRSKKDREDLTWVVVGLHGLELRLDGLLMRMKARDRKDA